MLEDKEGQRERGDEDLLGKLWSTRNVRPMLLPTRWWPRTVDPLGPPQIGGEMLGFNNEAQGWLPCKVVEKAPQERHWTVDWWDNSQEDRTKGDEDLRPFEEAGWWYRIIQKTRIGIRKIGSRRGETRNVGNVPIRVSDTRSKRGLTSKEDAQKIEDAGPLIKQCLEFIMNRQSESQR